MFGEDRQDPVLVQLHHGQQYAIGTRLWQAPEYLPFDKGKCFADRRKEPPPSQEMFEDQFLKKREGPFVEDLRPCRQYQLVHFYPAGTCFHAGLAVQTLREPVAEDATQGDVTRGKRLHESDLAPRTPRFIQHLGEDGAHRPAQAALQASFNLRSDFSDGVVTGLVRVRLEEVQLAGISCHRTSSPGS